MFGQLHCFFTTFCCRFLVPSLVIGYSWTFVADLSQWFNSISHVVNNAALPFQLTGSRVRLRNDLYCVEWGVKLYSLTHSTGSCGTSGVHRKGFAATVVSMCLSFAYFFCVTDCPVRRILKRTASELCRLTRRVINQLQEKYFIFPSRNIWQKLWKVCAFVQMCSPLISKNLRITIFQYRNQSRPSMWSP